MTDNPYQAPAVQEVAAPVESDVETVRKSHLAHEASVKTVGLLYLLGGIFGFLSLAAMLLGVLSGGTAAGGQEIMIMAALALVFVVQLLAGLGMRRFTGPGKVLGVVLAVVSLFVFPIGTILGAYILYLLLGSKGKMVFSPGYQSVIAQTPHLRYRSPRWIWILLLLALVFFVMMMFITVR